MKQRLKKLCLLSGLAFTLAAPAFGQPAFTKFENGKVYLSPGSVYVSADQIYISHEDELLPVSIVHADDQGIYLTEEEFEIEPALRGQGHAYWICTYCGGHNDFQDYVCTRPNCRRSRR